MTLPVLLIYFFFLVHPGENLLVLYQLAVKLQYLYLLSNTSKFSTLWPDASSLYNPYFLDQVAVVQSISTLITDIGTESNTINNDILECKIQRKR